MESNIFDQLIREICGEQRIEVDQLSFGWIYQLKKNGQVRHIVGRQFDLNPEAAANIACDKYACYEVLQFNGVPVAEHYMVFNPLVRRNYISEDGIWSSVHSYFNRNNRKVVVKPTDGWQGKQVFLCENLFDLERSILDIFETKPSLCLCPYYDINYEYRVFYVYDECMAVYGKKRPFVVGDGVNTVESLAEQQSLPIANCIGVDYYLYIPAEGEKVEVSWKHNLSGGAQPFLLDDKALTHRLYELAQKAADCVNIRFATIDIAQIASGELIVLEINSGVATTKFNEKISGSYSISKKIYKKAIDKMFLLN